MAQTDREKAAIDAIVARIEAQDAAAAQEKRQRQVQLSEGIREQQRVQAALRLEAQQAEEAEDRRRQQYSAAKQALLEKEATRNATKQERADWAYDQLKQKQEEEARRREQEEDLINLLRAEEAAERDRATAEAHRERQHALRADMMAANKAMLRLKEERRQQAKEEEARLRREMLAALAERERLDQMTAQRARLWRAEHAREVERLLAQKRAAAEAAQAKELAADAAQQAEASKRAALLQEERLKLLREAAAVRERLPPGALTADDLETMRREELI
ncbi:g6852 [Coccomyxa elongata]